MKSFFRKIISPFSGTRRPTSASEAGERNVDSEPREAEQAGRIAGRKTAHCDLDLAVPLPDHTLTPLTFLKEHTGRHKTEWREWLEFVERPFTARNVFAYGALLEFAFAGTLSRFDDLIGPVAVATSRHSRDTMRFLCDLAQEGTGEELSSDQFQVQAVEIRGGSCVVVTLPPPTAELGAHAIGIVTDRSLKKLSFEEKGDDRPALVYFTLEESGKARPTICEWRFRETFRKHDLAMHTEYGIEVAPQAPSFVTAIERIMNSGGWTFASGWSKLKRCDAEGARRALDAVLSTPDAPDQLKLLAFIGSRLVCAVSGSDVISLPGVHFEHEIMRRHFCAACRVRTENQRLSGSTQYLSQAIVDHWRASCPQCKNERRIRFAVPPS